MKNNAGFTLLELMIVITILGVLAALVIPTYGDSIVKARRSEAKTVIEQTSQALERCFTRFSAYDDANCVTAASITGGNNLESEDGWYEVTGALNSASYTLTATPTGTQATDDALCGTYTLTNTGVKSVSGSGSVDKCW